MKMIALEQESNVSVRIGATEIQVNDLRSAFEEVQRTGGTLSVSFLNEETGNEAWIGCYLSPEPEAAEEPQPKKRTYRKKKSTSSVPVYGEETAGEL